MLALFGSNVDRVLRQAPCPVLVARPLKHTQAPFVAELERMKVPEKTSRTISHAAPRTSWRDTLGEAGAQALTTSLRHMKEQS
jgi:hypothetical protein